MSVDPSAFITGAAGFAGSSLAKALLSKGHSVTGLDVVAPSHASLLQEELFNPNFRYLWKSLQDIQPSDVEGHSMVAHLAAQPDTPMAFDSPRYTVMQNIGGTVELLEAVRRAGGVTKVLFAASGNELGRPLYLPMDEDHPLTPHNPYGFSKAAAELAMWAWHRAYGIPSVVLSTGVVVGPNMRREVFIFKWLWNALHGRPIVIEGGRQTRDLTYIDDVIRAWMLAIEAPTERVVGQKFYVGFGEEHTVEELAGMCCAVTGSDVQVEYAHYRPGEEGQREAFSTEKAQRMLGYNPQVPPTMAISLTAGWISKSLMRSTPAGLDAVGGTP